MESETRNTFSAQKKNNHRFMIFDPKKWRGVFFSTFLTPQPPQLPENPNKVGFKLGGGGLGGSGPKTHCGMRLDKTMML